MSEFRRDIEETSEAARDYFKAELDLFRLKLTEQATELVANLITRIILIAALLIPILMGFLAMGSYLSEFFGSITQGFLAAFGVSSLLLLAVFFLRKSLVANPIQDDLIKKFSQILFSDED